MGEQGYSVSEAVRLIGVESHVLRYWEEELQVEIQRTGQGHRVYSEDNVRLFCRVKALKEKGLQLKAIRELMEEGYLERQEAEVEEQLCRLAGETPSEAYEVLSKDPPRDSLRQFEDILRTLLEEVTARQNEILRQALADMIKDEMETLYLRYFQAMQETAAAARPQKSGKRRLRELLERLF